VFTDREGDVKGDYCSWQAESEIEYEALGLRDRMGERLPDNNSGMYPGLCSQSALRGHF